MNKAQCATRFHTEGIIDRILFCNVGKHFFAYVMWRRSNLVMSSRAFLFKTLQILSVPGSKGSCNSCKTNVWRNWITFKQIIVLQQPSDSQAHCLPLSKKVDIAFRISTRKYAHLKDPGGWMFFGNIDLCILFSSLKTQLIIFLQYESSASWCAHILNSVC